MESVSRKHGSAIVIAAAAAAAGVIGCIGLAGWISGALNLASFGTDGVPMAPSTAVLCCILNGAVIVEASFRRSARIRSAVNAVFLMIAVAAAILGTLSIWGIHPAFEHTGLSIDDEAFPFRIGHMSPITAADFLIAALCFAGLTLPDRGNTRRFQPELLGSASVILLGVNAILTVPYLYGRPLFYGSQFIPPSFPTTVAFIFTGTALCASAFEAATGRRTRPGMLREDSTGMYAAVFIAFSAGVVAVGAVMIRNVERDALQKHEANLQAIAELKRNELLQFRHERLADADALWHNQLVTEMVRAFIGPHHTLKDSTVLASFLSRIGSSFGYEQSAVLSRDGAERLEAWVKADTKTFPFPPEEVGSADTTSVSVRFYFPPTDLNAMRIDVFIPVVDEPRAHAPIAFIVLRVDPVEFLGNLLRPWTSSLKTSETMLSRVVGDSLEVLSLNRQPKRGISRFRVARTAANRISFERTLEAGGFYRGKDHRDTEVFIWVQQAPGSPWSIIVRTDAAELYSPMRRQAWLLLGLAAALIASAGGGLGLIWRNQRLVRLGEAVGRLEALRRSERIVSLMYENAPVAYQSLDTTARILEVNETWLRETGLSPQQVIGKPVIEFLSAESRDRARAQFARFLESGELRNGELEFVKPDGGVVVYAVQGQATRDDGGAVKQTHCVLHNVTDRNRTEAQLRKLNRVYAVLGDINEAIVRVHAPQVLLDEVCTIGVRDGGFALVWIGTLDRSTDRFAITAKAGNDDGYVEEIVSALNNPAFRGGPIRQTLETGTHFLSNDIASDARLTPWRERILAAGYRSTIVLPISDGTALNTVIAFYSAEAEFFDGEEVRLLSDLARDLEFALRYHKNETLRVRAEEALRKSERLYRDIFDSAPMGVYLSSPEGKFTAANSRLASILGYDTVDELLQLNLAEDVYANPFERAEIVRACEQSRIAVDIELQWKRRDGSVIWVSLSLHAVRDESGTTQSLEGFVYDITVRRALEEHLRESESRLREAQRVASLGHYNYDVSQNVWTSSETLDEVFGIPPGYDKSVASWLEIVHPDDRETMAEYLTNDVLVGGKSFDMTYRILRQADNSTRWVHGLGTVERDGHGSPIRMFGTIQDVTAMKHAEAELRRIQSELFQAQKLESIGTLAAGIAHDFNNILGIIVGYTDLIKQGSQNPELLEQATTTITSAVERGAGLVRQILTFARQSGVTFGQLDINVLVKEVAKLFAETFPKNISVEWRLESGLPSIVADASQIHQLLLNLGVNARDAMPGGGELIYATESIPGSAVKTVLPEAGEARYVHLSVADTGCGIGEENLQRIFEPFFTTKEFGKGTGLGLSVVYGIAKSHRSHIRVESAVGKGTTFHVYIPAAEIAEPTPIVADGPGPNARGNGQRILLVEDEALLSDMGKSTLEKSGYQVTPAFDGNEGIEKYRCERDRIDLVVTDIGLPGVSGVEVVRSILGENPSAKIIVTSGYLEEQRIDELKRLGVSTFLPKPYKPKELVCIVTNVLGVNSGP